MDNDLITLGLDLVWSGPTGIALMEDRDQGRAMHALSPYRPPAQAKNADPSEYRIQQATAFHRYLRELCLDLKPSVVAIEINDWIQKGRKREKTVQRALSNAAGVIYLPLGLIRDEFPDLTLMELGTTKVTRQIAGAANADKLTVAPMLQATYPDDLPLPSPGGPFNGYDAVSTLSQCKVRPTASHSGRRVVGRNRPR